MPDSMEAPVSSKPVRTLLTVAMNVLIFVAIALTVRLVVMFFGQIASLDWAKSIVSITNLLVIPFGVEPIKTPYGGVFDANAALTILVVLVVEWVLSLARGRS
jgi:hypothetical protein